jgi:hypothetical protein
VVQTAISGPEAEQEKNQIREPEERRKNKLRGE